MGYFCCIIFANLGSFLISEIYCTNLKFEFELEYLFWTLYIFGYLHLGNFCFAWAHSTTCIGVLLAEYGLVTHGGLNFMEDKEA